MLISCMPFKNRRNELFEGIKIDISEKHFTSKNLFNREK